MIKAVIIDDEKHAVATLKWKLERFCPEVEVVATFTDSEQGLSFLKEEKFHLLFLDIEMPRLNGFEILEELEKPLPFDVIFTTAYDEFGIRAIKQSALDYLLKPIQNKELKLAIQKFIKKQQPNISSEQLDVLFTNVPSEKNKSGKIGLATKQSIEFVFPDEIIACSSDSNYTQVFLTDGRKRLISKTLKDVEESLTGHSFFRTHHSHLVNLKHVQEYKRTDGGYLVMSNNMNIPVSRSKKDELLKQF